MNSIKLMCCDQEPRWVENIPGKGYHFCDVCRNEVLQPSTVEAIDNALYLDNIFVDDPDGLSVFDNIDWTQFPNYDDPTSLSVKPKITVDTYPPGWYTPGKDDY